MLGEDKKKKFYLIATPIGNRDDISLRALKVFKELDVLLCEDTRVTKKVLSYYDINIPRIESYHAQSKKKKTQDILHGVEGGKIYGLVSDAGTPTVSDPGSQLVSLLYDTFGDEIDIISIPGPTALITALSVSGFFGNQFTFYGFLPHKKGREKIFNEIFSSSRIAVFYESPHRLMKTLKFLHEQYPNSSRKVFVARELTKMYEEKIRGTIQEVYSFFEDHPDKVRGEFVIVIEGEK